VNDSEPARWADVKNGVTGIDEPIPSQTGNAKTPLTTSGTGLVFGQIEADHVDFTNSGTGGVERTLQAKLEDVVNVKDYGAVVDGVANDATAVANALTASGNDVVTIHGTCLMQPTSAEAVTILDNIDKLHVMSPGSVLELPDVNGTGIAVTDSTRIPHDLGNLAIRGASTSSTTATSVSQTGGSAKAYTVQYTLADATNVDVGDYILVKTATGSSGSYRVVEGCFEVTAKAGSIVDVTHPLNNTWPSYVFTSATVQIIKTIIQYPADRIGLRLNGGSLGELKRVVLKGAFDISTDTPADSPDDGIQVGGTSDTSVTGLNESQQTNSGSLWAQVVGVVDFEGNGVQVAGGNAYFETCSTTGNGWRGFQASRSGGIVCKGTSAVGNGASGYEVEGNGGMNANNSVASGNWEQGYYGIGPSSMTCSSTQAISNVTNGYDVRNGSIFNADGGDALDNTLDGVSCTAGQITFGSSATSSGNGSDDVYCTEGGVVNGNGASSLGTINLVAGSGGVVVDTDGEVVYPTSVTLVENNTHTFDISQSSVGDTNLVIDGTSFWRLKVGGNLLPVLDNTYSLGESGNEIANTFTNTIKMRSPDNTLWTITVSNAGALVVS